MILVDITQYEPFECQWFMHLRARRFARHYFNVMGFSSLGREDQIKNARISMYLELLGSV